MKKTIGSTKRQVFLFFLATYVFSWSMFALGSALDVTPILLIGIWGPSLMSLFFTYRFYGKQGLRSFFGRFKRANVRWYWWLALILLPAAIHLGGRSLWQLYYEGEVNPFYLPLQYWAGSIIPSFLIAGFGEEMGWRGFALPRLQQHYSATKSALILGLFHTMWHLPTYWLGQGIHNVPGIYVLLFVLPWTFIFCWLYNRSGGSLIFAVSFHAISNASLSIIRFMPTDNEVPISPELITQTSLPSALAGPYLSVIAVYAVVALLVWKFGKFNKVNTDVP
ncbi:MAG: CPBP family intramembrane metalloprotease [Roseivirga sp.]|nr:CPBP family intramembrane metalloprotease [Roseivirga sp.]